MPISLSGSLLLTGSLTTNGTITAQTLVVQVITSSIVNFTGSNTFGSTTSNVQQMTGSLRVTGSGDHYIVGGNVGIGIISPVSKLDVRSTSSDTDFTDNNFVTSGPVFSTVWNESSTDSSFSALSLVARNTAGTGQSAVILAQSTSSGYAPNIIFGQRNAAGTGTTERMRINPSGSVGIGTTSPSYKLDVSGDLRISHNSNQPLVISTTSTTLYTTYISNSTTVGYIGNGDGIVTGGGATNFGIRAENNLLFAAGGGSERMRISGSGNVGIGTTTPSGKLHVESSDQLVFIGRNTQASSYTSLRLYNDQNSALRALEIDYFGSTASGGERAEIFATGAYPLLFGTNNTARMYISGSGNVGIGTTSPGYKLDVNGTFRSNALWTDASAVAYWGSGVTPTVYGVLTWDTSLARIYGSSGNRLELGANATVYLTIGTTGNVTLNSTVYNNTAAATVRTLYIGGDYIIGGVSSTRESKTNIETITDVNWLYALDPVSFNYRKKGASGSYTEEYYEDKAYGLIAEDVAPINDLLCNYDNNEDGTKKLVGIEYPRLIVPLLKALQQQQAKITELESRIQQLENK